MNTYYSIILLFCVLCTGCVEQAQKIDSEQYAKLEAVLEIPNSNIEKSALLYNNKISLWTLEGQPYSGHVTEYYQENVVKEKFELLEGRKQNQSISYYPDGRKQFVSNYYKGKLHGEKKAWSSDSSHVLLSHLNYYMGKAHGEQKKWYVTGEIFKILNLNMGREEGLQQAFRKNGALFANYEAKDGRIYGLKKATLCFGLDDEEIK